jgi:nucleoside-diphosphate-sugar epimerase
MRILITGGNGNLAKMIFNGLHNNHIIHNPNRQQLDILDLNALKNYLELHTFDILIHTAISGGRRTKEESGDVTHTNLLMWENILTFADRFKMIIQFDSGAIYDRATDIMNRGEEDLFTVPSDYYGFSKYVIYKRSLQYSNVYNFRVFNIFHPNEEPDRFIKKCFLAKQNNTEITIFEDKYFDFVYEDDFIKIIKHYVDNTNNQTVLHKTINICYDTKYKLSEIAKIILGNNNNIIVNDTSCLKNYCGNHTKLYSLGITLDGIRKSLDKFIELNMSRIN